MVSRNELLERLKELNLAQFEEILFRLEIDPAIIPSSFAEQSIRAIRVIRRLQQERDGLERLEKTLAEPAISIVGKQYIGYEIEAQVKRIVDEYTQQPFEGREEEKRRLDEFIDKNPSGVLLVTGAAGFGKSALLSHWQQTRQEDYFIAYHCFSYRSEKTRSVSEAYRHLLKQLYLYYNIRNGQFPNDENGMRDILVGMLDKPVSSEGKRLVIVLDGLDEADKTFEPFFTGLPAGVFVIASARAEEGDEPKYLRNWTDNAQRLHLKRLPREAIPKWLGQISELAAYSEDEEFIRSLDETTGGFPLYLRFLIDDLREAVTQSQDVREVLAQTPEGFEGYVEQQLERLDELDLPEQRWQFFALLAVAKGVLEKEDIKALTQMRDRDLRQLHQSWRVTRWMQITEDKFYAFAHPLLAKTFGDKLGDDAEDTLRELMDYCAKWQEHHSAYALRYYAEHLEEAKQWEELYELARNQKFVTVQRKYLPDELDLPLKTVRIALRGKAETDDTGGMAEFLLLHAGRLMQTITQESPLEALRSGSVERAWKLADQFEIESRILWYLLLAWTLATDIQDTDRMDLVRKTLERLQEQKLPRLRWEQFGGGEDWKANCAVYLLTHILVVTNEAFIALPKLILDDRSLRKLCINFVESGNIDRAIEIAGQIDHPFQQAWALCEIAIAQAQAGDFTSAQTSCATALQMVGQIDDSSQRAETLGAIAIAQAQSGKSTAAQQTAEQIDDAFQRAVALGAIAITQAQSGDLIAAQTNFAAAQKTVGQIDDSQERARVFSAIAVAHAQSGDLTAAQTNFAAAQKTVGQIDDSSQRAWALKEIATDQAQAGDFATARQTAEQIDDSLQRALALGAIAIAQAQSGDVTDAQQTAEQIGISWGRAEVLSAIAIAQAQSGNSTTAQQTAGQIDDFSQRAETFSAIAIAQAQSGNFTAAQTSFATAQQTTGQIDSSSQRAEALSAIATAQAQSGDFTAAHKTVEQIDDSSQRAEALSAIATAQAQSGDFTAAQQTAEQIDSSWQREWALREIATAQAQSGDFTAAQQTAEQIDSSWQRVETLKEIATMQAQSGNLTAAQTSFVAALQTTGRIDDLWKRAGSLKEIATAQAQSGDIAASKTSFAAALQTAGQIDSSWKRAEALGEIATAQAQSGDLTAAQQMAEQIDNSYERAEVLSAIATVQAQSGDFTAAQQTAEQIDNSYEQAEALSAIATAQAQSGDFTAAQQTAEQIDDSREWAEALKEITTVQAQFGDFTAAQQTVEQIDNYYYYKRAMALWEIASAAAKAGCSQKALSIVEKILTHRNKVLPGIASAFVETDDKENFKQLLIPCAYYLDAAYEMCGYLAKLYPTQAIDIANIVKEFTVSST